MTLNEIGFNPLLVLAQQANALQFGSFTLKSGRQSPYFFDVGAFSQGDHMAALGDAYATTIAENYPEVEVVCGPSYKGYAIAVATATALTQRLGRAVSWCADRKEAKIHGADQNHFVGAQLAPGRRVVIVDDVMTTGATKRELVEKVKATGAQIEAVVIALDRQETTDENRRHSAAQEFTSETGIQVTALANLDGLCAYAVGSGVGDPRAITEYRQRYGVAAGA